MAEGLGQMALAGAARPDDEHRGALVEVAPGGQIVDQGAIELGQALEVELLERLAGAEGGAAQAQGELLLLAAGDLVLDEQGEELGVGELGVDGLAVARLQRIEDAGQAQLLEMRGELGNGVHAAGTPWVSETRGFDAERSLGVAGEARAGTRTRRTVRGDMASSGC